MARARFLSPLAESNFVSYHCVSRVVDRQFIFRDREKNVFVSMMRKYEVFCGVQVLAFCVMGNHFHILVEVPPKKKGAAVELSDGEFLRRIRALYSRQHYLDVAQMLGRFRSRGQTQAASEFMARYTRRMHDLSEFFKGLKQRFSRWYNGVNSRSGTLWEGRFKSVLVEDGYAARVMAAYIDLNPIRAGMVKKPEDYQWSSYGEAMLPDGVKSQRARRGLCRVLEKYTSLFNRVSKGMKPGDLIKDNSWKNGLAERYRVMLFADGEEAFASVLEAGEKPRKIRRGFSRDEVAEVLVRGGKLTMGEALRCRVRYFSDGVTFGSREFVDEVFQLTKERFGKKRTTGARAIRGLSWNKLGAKLFTMRDLVKERMG